MSERERKPGDGIIHFPHSRTPPSTTPGGFKDLGITPLARQLGLSSDKTSGHRIQETHVAIYHILWDLVHTLLADQRGNLSRSPA
ncbi:hypothetical protein [Polaromonas sp.]|uniref:hypothetical protein n=1 Tax=Polaromonas sp. TaxID=1869339 RepID=UPI00286D57B5|nr:hypothetical protein [Polaromonas sp.]